MKISTIIVMILCIVFPATLIAMKQEQLEAAICRGDWRMIKAACKDDTAHVSRSAHADPESGHTYDWQAGYIQAQKEYRNAKRPKVCAPSTLMYAGIGLFLIGTSGVLAAYNTGNDIYDLTQGIPWFTVVRTMPSQVAASVSTLAGGLKMLYYAFVQRPRQQQNNAALVKATIGQYAPINAQLGNGLHEVWAMRSRRPGVAGKKGRIQESLRLREEMRQDGFDCCSCMHLPISYIIDRLAQRGGKN